MAAWIDVPEGGGSAAASFVRAVVLLGIVFGPWLLGASAVGWLVWRAAKKRRARLALPPDDSRG